MGEILLKEDMTEQEYVKWLLSLKHKKTGKQRFSAEQARSHAKQKYAPKKPERKSATAETELYRLLSKKQYKTLLAKNDLTLQQVQKVLKNVISKVKKRGTRFEGKPKHSKEFLTYSEADKQPIDRMPKITWSSKQLKDAWGGPFKPRGLKVSDAKFIADSLFTLKDYMDEKEWEVISKVTKIIRTSPKTQETTRNMSVQERTLNEILSALKDNVRLTDADKKKLVENKINSSKFLLKLDESMWRGKKTVHPVIIDNLITMEDGKRKPSDLYKKFERFMKGEFGRGLPSASKLRRVAERISAKKTDRASVPHLIRQLNNDSYKYSQANSGKHFSKLVKSFEQSIGGDGKFYQAFSDFIEEKDGTEDWGIDELDTDIRSQYDKMTQSEKKGKDFDDFRAEKIIDIVQEIEEEYEKIVDHKKAIEALEQIVNDNTDKNLDESLTQFPNLQSILDFYEGAQENITEYKQYQSQAQEKIKAKRERETLHREVTSKPKSDEEKQWEKEFFAEKAQELVAEEERKKKTMFPTETRRVKDKESPEGFKTMTEDVDLSRVKRFGKEKLTASLETMKDAVSQTSLKGAETNLKNIEDKIQRTTDKFKQSPDYRKLLRLINPGRGDPYYSKRKTERFLYDKRFKYQKQMDDLFDKFNKQPRMQKLYESQKEYQQQIQAFERIPQVEQLLENWRED